MFMDSNDPPHCWKICPPGLGNHLECQTCCEDCPYFGKMRHPYDPLDFWCYDYTIPGGCPNLVEANYVFWFPDNWWLDRCDVCGTNSDGTV